jgi:hypothetical protein
MKYFKEEWETKHGDNNNGFIYGIVDEEGLYIEWFKTKKARDNAFKKVVGK